MSRNKGFHLAEVKSRSARDVERKKDRVTRMRRVIHNKEHEVLLGVPFQLLAFPASWAFFRVHSQGGYSLIAFSLEESLQQCGKIGACGAQPQKENRLRTIGEALHKASSESQDVEMRQIKPAECGWHTEALGLQIGRQRRL